MDLTIAEELCRWSSVGFALLSAYYWYRASMAKITGPSRHSPGAELGYEDPDHPGQQIHVIASAMEQMVDVVEGLVHGRGAYTRLGQPLTEKPAEGD